MTRSIEGRLDRLDRTPEGDRPLLVVYQDLDDRDLYHVGSRYSDQVMTWTEIEDQHPDHVIFKVEYIDNWRCTDD